MELYISWNSFSTAWRSSSQHEPSNLNTAMPWSDKAACSISRILTNIENTMTLPSDSQSRFCRTSKVLSTFVNTQPRFFCILVRNNSRRFCFFNLWYVSHKGKFSNANVLFIYVFLIIVLYCSIATNNVSGFWAKGYATAMVPLVISTIV